MNGSNWITLDLATDVCKFFSQEEQVTCIETPSVTPPCKTAFLLLHTGQNNVIMENITLEMLTDLYVSSVSFLRFNCYSILKKTRDLPSNN